MPSTKTKTAAPGGLPRLLTIAEVADLLAINERQVREQMYRGRLRQTHLGKNVRVHPDDLKAFIDAGREQR